MRKVINSKIYDTEKAQCIAEYSNGLPSTDFNYVVEELYRTKKGNWFLYIEGGAATCYNETYGNYSTSGRTIKPIYDSQAIKWLEEHDFVDELEEFFSNELEEA